jgi:hypothetical protein
VLVLAYYGCWPLTSASLVFEDCPDLLYCSNCLLLFVNVSVAFLFSISFFSCSSSSLFFFSSSSAPSALTIA